MRSGIWLVNREKGGSRSESGSEVATVWHGRIGKIESYVHSQFYVLSSCLGSLFYTWGVGQRWRSDGGSQSSTLASGGLNLCFVVVVVIVLGDYFGVICVKKGCVFIGSFIVYEDSLIYRVSWPTRDWVNPSSKGLQDAFLYSCECQGCPDSLAIKQGIHMTTRQ